MQIGKDHLYAVIRNGALVDWLCLNKEVATYDFRAGCEYAIFSITDRFVDLVNSEQGKRLLKDAKVVLTNKALFGTTT